MFNELDNEVRKKRPRRHHIKRKYKESKNKQKKKNF